MSQSELKYRALVTCLVYPHDSIPRQTAKSFSIADILHERIVRDQGDSADIMVRETASGIGIGNVIQWFDPNTGFPNIDEGIEFIDLSGNMAEGASAKRRPGATAGTSGFYVKGRVELTNCMSSFEGQRPPRINKKFPKVSWKVTRGNQDDWESKVPEKPPYRALISLVRQGADKVKSIRSVEKFVKNQQFDFTVIFDGVASGSKAQAACRVSWGDDTISLILRYGASPAIERMSVQGDKSDWKNYQRLDEIGPIDFSEPLNILIRRIAGRLCVTINNKKQDFLDTSPPDNPNGAFKPKDFEWPAGSVAVTSYCVMVSFGLGRILYKAIDTAADPAKNIKKKKGVPYKGKIQRIYHQVYAEVNAPDDPASRPVIPGFDPNAELIFGDVAGWHTPATKVVLEADILSAFTGAIQYTVNMTCSPDGIDTPFAARVLARFGGREVAVPGIPMDISAALKTISVSGAEPPLVPGYQITASVDRNLLDLLAEDQGISDWSFFVQQYNPIVFTVQWITAEGFAVAGEQGEQIVALVGYIEDISMNNEGGWSAEIVVRDPTFRLQRPASTIDHMFMPLDYIFFTAPGADNNTAVDIYGWMCVKEILRSALGESVAESMAHIFNEARSWPLFDASGSGGAFRPTLEPIVSNGWQFPPPWGEDAWSWINEFCPKDFAIFFFGYVAGAQPYINGGVTWSVPIYGEYYAITAGRTPIVIPDADYFEGDQDSVLFGASTHTMGATNYNRCLVWSSAGGDSGLLPWPSLQAAEAIVQPPHFNTPSNSWERTLIIRFSNQMPAPPGILQHMADDAVYQWAGLDYKRVTLTFRGNIRIQWGDILQPKMLNSGPDFSDIKLNLDGKKFQVIRVDHRIDCNRFDGSHFTTTAVCVPLSRLQDPDQ